MNGGGAAGGGGSGAGPAATQYMPQAQPQADVAYQGIVQNLFPYANNPSISPAGQAYGTLNPYTNQLANQDLINQGSQGSQNAYNNYLTSVYPAAQNLGSLIPGGAITSYIQAQSNPYTNQAIQGALTGSGYADPTAAGAATGAQNLLASAPNYQQWGAGTGSNIQSLFNPLVGAAQTTSSNIGALAPQAQGLGTQGQEYLQGLAPQASSLGGAGQQYLQGLAPGALATGGATQQAINQAISPLQGLSSQVLNTAFDPQQALYNRTQQQVVDQARAASAAAGLSGSPYGAGVENQATENFNIDWQNQQLQRQATGAQAGTAIQNAIAQMIGQGGAAAQQGTQLAGSLFGTGTGLGQQGLTTAGNLFGAGTGLGQQGVTTAGNLYGAGLGALTSGYGQAGNLNALGDQVTNQGATTAANLYGSGLNLGQGATNLAALGGALPQNAYYGGLQSGTAVQDAIARLAQSGLNIGTQGAQGLSTFAGQPYSSLGQAINSILTPGLSNAAQLGQQQFQLPQQVLQDLQSYLGLGQAASLNSGYLGNLGLQQTSQALSGLGQAAGGINSLFGNSGALSGLFGAGAGAAGADVTGLLSPAASAAFPAFDATTQTLLSGGGAAAAGGGIGDFFASLLPFAL